MHKLGNFPLFIWFTRFFCIANLCTVNLIPISISLSVSFTLSISIVFSISFFLPTRSLIIRFSQTDFGLNNKINDTKCTFAFYNHISRLHSMRGTDRLGDRDRWKERASESYRERVENEKTSIVAAMQLKWLRISICLVFCALVVIVNAFLGQPTICNFHSSFGIIGAVPRIAKSIFVKLTLHFAYQIDAVPNCVHCFWCD